MREWLESELRDAQHVLDGYLLEAKSNGLDADTDLDAMHPIRYWLGYVDALTNSLHEFAGMESEGY